VRHGNAVMPWGKYRGVRIRCLPDDYLSWLTTSAVKEGSRWWWLRESLLAELRFRGLNVKGVLLPDAQPVPLPLAVVPRTRRFRVQGEEASV
jgi:uncharacterized protein (DUF3820 family)